MPELPDVELYIAKLKQLVVGQPLVATKIVSLFVVRSVHPPIQTLVGHVVSDVFRIGKRIVFQVETPQNASFLVVHLMVAGRFLWRPGVAKLSGRITLALFHFGEGTLILTEAGSKKRASIHVVGNLEDLQKLDPGGLEPLECTETEFLDALRLENRTLKRALTSPRLFSGIGNAYSDEILWSACLSPLRLTHSLTDEEIYRLESATKQTLIEWKDRLLSQFKNKFPGPGDVTAFRPEFAVHGRFGQPCPRCGQKVQRIVYADNETNYCAVCQNEGRLLADRSLSRLLKSDWPKTLEEME